MKFEELLKPRENYYEATPSNTLDKYFKDIELKRKMEQEPVLTEEPVITESKKEAIKKVFGPPKEPVMENDGTQAILEQKKESKMATSAPVQEQSYTPQQTEMYAQQTQPVAASDLIDMEKVKAQVDSAMPKKSWADYLAYLAPLATEAIIGKGNTFVSGKIAAKMMKEDLTAEETRRKSLEDKLMEIQKARQLAAAKASGKGMKTLEVDVEGKPIIMRAEDALGKQAWKKTEADAFAEKVALEKLKANLRMKVAAGKATEAERKELRKIEMDLSQKWSSDPFTRDTRTVTDAYNKLSKVDPYSADPVKDISVIFDFMKTLDPNSVVRESEQGLVMGARSIQDITDNLKEVMTGQRKLTPTQILDIQRFAALNYNRRLESQASTVDKRFRENALAYGLDPDRVVGQLTLGTPLLYVNPKTGRTSVFTSPHDKVEEYLKLDGVQRIE